MNDKIFQRYHVVATPVPLPHVSILHIIVVPGPLSANPFCVPMVVPDPPVLWLQTSKVILQVTIPTRWNCPCCCSTLPFLLYLKESWRNTLALTTYVLFRDQMCTPNLFGVGHGCTGPQ